MNNGTQNQNLTASSGTSSITISNTSNINSISGYNVPTMDKLESTIQELLLIFGAMNVEIDENMLFQLLEINRDRYFEFVKTKLHTDEGKLKFELLYGSGV